MVGDQPLGPLGDRPLQGLQGGLDVVGRVDRLAHVVQQGRQQELLVVRPLVPRQLEDLQAVIKRIPLRMILGALLDPFERLEQHPEEQEGVELVLEPLDLGFQVDVGMLLVQQCPSSSAIDARSIALPVIELLKT